MSDDNAALLDIIRAATLALRFKGRFRKAVFARDLKTRSAVLHQLLILGEAVRRLTPEFQVRHPAIPWKDISGMRNRLIHEYDAVDLDAVWHTLVSDLPALLKEVRRVAPKRKAARGR